MGMTDIKEGVLEVNRVRALRKEISCAMKIPESSLYIGVKTWNRGYAEEVVARLTGLTMYDPGPGPKSTTKKVKLAATWWDCWKLETRLGAWLVRCKILKTHSTLDITIATTTHTDVWRLCPHVAIPNNEHHVDFLATKELGQQGYFPNFADQRQVMCPECKFMMSIDEYNGRCSRGEYNLLCMRCSGEMRNFVPMAFIPGDIDPKRR